MDMKVSNLLDEFSRKSIAPGGGSASAIVEHLEHLYVQWLLQLALKNINQIN